MASVRRFENNLGDYYEGVTVRPDVAMLKGKIMDLANQMINKFPPVPKNPATEGKAEGSLYVGLGGMAYSLWHIAKSGILPEHNSRLLQTAKMYMEIALGKIFLKHVDAFDEVAFLLGNVGNYLAAAFIYESLGEKEKLRDMIVRLGAASGICEPIRFHKHGSDELFVGRAGYLTAVQSAIRVLGQGSPVHSATRQKLTTAMLESGLSSESQFRKSGQCPLMYAYYGEEYLGMAHGLTGILLALLNEPSVHANAESIQQVKRSVDFVLQTQAANGNFHPGTNELTFQRPPEHELVHWCHGAPGVINLLAKAYLVFKEEKYLQGCIKAADCIWKRGLIKKGPGICHGIAGNGYAFLLMYRLTGDDMYYHRALQFAQFIFTSDFEMGARSPDEPWSLYEGWAGTICFLVDLLQPNKAELPFAHVF